MLPWETTGGSRSSKQKRKQRNGKPKIQETEKPP